MQDRNHLPVGREQMLTADVEYDGQAAVDRHVGRGKSMSRYFSQECPVCGRPLHIDSAWDGHDVRCGHCLGSFVARRQADGSSPVAARVNHLIRRADQLLIMCAQRRYFIDGSRTAATANIADVQDFGRYGTARRGRVREEVLCRSR
jgi:hypothetical protein